MVENQNKNESSVGDMECAPLTVHPFITAREREREREWQGLMCRALFSLH